jgi:hypothetical protein
MLNSIGNCPSAFVQHALLRGEHCVHLHGLQAVSSRGQLGAQDPSFCSGLLSFASYFDECHTKWLGGVDRGAYPLSRTFRLEPSMAAGTYWNLSQQLE